MNSQGELADSFQPCRLPARNAFRCWSNMSLFFCWFWIEQTQRFTTLADRCHRMPADITHTTTAIADYERDGDLIAPWHHMLHPRRPTLRLAFLQADYHVLASQPFCLAQQYSLKCLGPMSSSQEWLINYGCINDLECLRGKNVLLNVHQQILASFILQ